MVAARDGERDQRNVVFDAIREIHTLGPEGTNCEEAARFWFSRQQRAGDVRLHATLEEAAAHVLRDRASALLACIVYPDLHSLVFTNLGQLRLVDVFLMDTLNMVLAESGAGPIRTVASHPAPSSLVPAAMGKPLLVASNAEAARMCAVGEVDACITTARAAQLHGLRTLRDFGAVSMGFSLHVPQP